MSAKIYRVLVLVVLFMSGGHIGRSLNVLPNVYDLDDDNVLVSYITNDRFTIHEPVIVKFTIENNLREVILFDLGQNRKSNFSIMITTPDGSEFKVPNLSWNGASRIGRMSLGTNRTYSQELLLNEWYDFDEVGIYQVAISLTDQIKTSDGIVILPLTKNIVSFQIGPRDEVLLKQKCESLMNAIEQAKTYSDASEAALRLSYVKDSLCIPFLKRAIESHKLIDEIAIFGLGRIATNEALEALISVAQKKNYEPALQAKAVLRSLVQNVQDSTLKEKIFNVTNY
jgi:hypothetical protein